MTGSKELLLPLTIVPLTQSKNPFGPVLWRCLLLVGVCVYGSYSILIHASEDEDHKIPFSSSSVVIMIELTKLFLCVAFSAPQSLKTMRQLTVKTCLPFTIPAALYCVNNNIAIHMQIQMDPATFQILCNLKILSTALLYRIIIRRHLSSVQWFSLILLAVAGVNHSYGGLVDKETVTKEAYITWLGVAMMLVYCTLSGLSGVYSEYILKKQQQLSLVVQNIVLYVYGLAFNCVLYWFSNGSGNHEVSQEFFSGYTVWTWLLIVTQAVNGLIISAIMKHSSNITRLFVISSAMIVTTFLSVTIFSLKLNFYLVTACILVVVALALYHWK